VNRMLKQVKKAAPVSKGCRASPDSKSFKDCIGLPASLLE
jgi:hypothetical protein